MKALPKYGQLKVKEPEILLWSTDKKVNKIISIIVTFIHFCIFIAACLAFQYYMLAN